MLATNSTHEENRQTGRPRHSDGIAPVVGESTEKVIENELVIDQGPTKPLRLPWKERLRQIARAMGLK